MLIKKAQLIDDLLYGEGYVHAIDHTTGNLFVTFNKTANIPMLIIQIKNALNLKINQFETIADFTICVKI